MTPDYLKLNPNYRVPTEHPEIINRQMQIVLGVYPKDSIYDEFVTPIKDRRDDMALPMIEQPDEVIDALRAAHDLSALHQAEDQMNAARQCAGLPPIFPLLDKAIKDPENFQDAVYRPAALSASDGSTASYYQLPTGATELQDLISYRNMNAQDGEIFRAIYRKGKASHSDELRDARKVLFYAQAEVKRLEQVEKQKPPPKPSIYDSEEMKKACAAALEALNRFPHKKPNDFLAPGYTAEEFKENCVLAAQALEGTLPVGWQGVK
jgi:hypothetical protein